MYRYRGYYYDADLGLYYLNSKYYDSVVGRFISADNQLSTGSDLTGLNLFAYCGNNPVKSLPGCMVDGIDFNNRIIYELKPNNPQAIARGMQQLNRYTSAASQQFGGIWTGVLKLYD